MDALEQMAREAYDRAIGLDLSDLAVDCCITKAPCGGEKAGKSPVDRGKRGLKTFGGRGRLWHPSRSGGRPSKPPRLAASGSHSGGCRGLH